MTVVTWRDAALTLILALACVPAAAAGAAGEAERLHDLFRREWAARLESSPFTATSAGVHHYDDRLPALDAESLARDLARWEGFLAESRTIERGALDEADRVNLEMFTTQLENRIADHRLGGHEIPFNADSGFWSGFSALHFSMPFDTAEQYANYLSRLVAWPRYVDQQIALMRNGLARGMTQPREILNGIEASMLAHVVDDPEDSVFYRPLLAMPERIPATERAALQLRAREAIREAVVPGYRKLAGFMAGEYRPNARETLGATALPGGDAYYRQQIREYTTLDLSPREIHEIGLREVARIRAEMEAVVKDVGFEGDFAAFLEFLRTDPRFYAQTPEQLLKEAAWIAKRMDGKLPSLFGRLPRQPYTVEPVPADIAPRYTAGRYVDAPLESSQPGRYWVNTYDLKTRPLYNLEALSLHEAVPGHHLQISLSKELDGLPEFRRYSYISAFGEGWGLYSEWLGLEAGFYTDPYSDFGRLTYEMWRACRLVVDTGVHALGWSRQQMLDYLGSNTALSLHEVATETDRYISWPGQALAYKMGEIKIRELRRRAETALGPRFDVRAFHDAVLAEGSIPLAVLERRIDRFIAEAAKRP